MIIKKPSIFIYVFKPDPSVLKDVCAGIEEEGVFYEIKEMEEASPDALAWAAANDSMPGSGIGVRGSGITLKMRGLPKGRSIEAYQEPDREQCRKLGSNSARVIKKMPLK